MGRPEEEDLFLGWNLGPSTGPLPAPRASDATRSWPGKSPHVRPRADVPDRRDEARSPDRPPTDLGPIADFTLHPGLGLDADGGDWSGGPDGRRETIGAGSARASGSRGGEPIAFPKIGEGIGGFRLVAELGRGAFGRVYLAEESGLGNRPVALKITRPEGEEPRLLARLQHTHIVPIHSVQDDPETGLRLMCMPYFGGANLARVLEAVGRAPSDHSRGRSLIEALDVVGLPSPTLRSARVRVDPPGGPTPAPKVGSSSLRSILRRIPWWTSSDPPAAGPRADADPDREPADQAARRLLRESSFVRASAWIAARLAEGLEHAHGRGLLHRDLKPSNILIAADGTPMLLDFNLAADCVAPEDGARAMVGGTLPYMAPEHLDAFNPDGATSPEAVDERADVYALGLILCEMLAGQYPFPEPPLHLPLLDVVRFLTRQRLYDVPSPRTLNRNVPCSLDAIVRKALDPNPARRFARAGDLAEDLRRFLEDRPLKFTREPSLGESLAKWARRNPKLTSGSSVALASAVLLGVVVSLTFAALGHFRAVSARLKLRAFDRDFQECQFLLNTTGALANDQGRGIGLAERAIRSAGLALPGERAGPSWLPGLSAEERATVRSDLAELILLTARARVARAVGSKSEATLRHALEDGVARLDLAEQVDPTPTYALFEERARYRSALGDADRAAIDRRRRDATPPASGRDFYLIGTDLLARDQPDRAEGPLLKAVGLDPRRFWGWFALGICHYEQGRFADSAGDFTVCAVLAPRVAWPWMNRGLALARSGRLVEAREAYDRAIEADDRFAEALANRALVALELNDVEAAVADLRSAVALGLKPTSVRVALGEALARSGRLAEGMKTLDELVEAEPDDPLPRISRGTIRLATDPGGARSDFQAVLASHPDHPAAHLGMARLLRESDPDAALPHADRAVEGDPNRPEALELRGWLRGRLGDRRAVDDVDRLVATPTPNRLYNAGCILGLLAKAHPEPALKGRAIDLLRRSLESGYPASTLRDDPDLESLRDDPAFRKLAGTDRNQ